MTFRALPHLLFALQAPAFREEYNWRIIAISSICILQTMGILLLLASRWKRHQSEKGKNISTAIFQTSDDAILSQSMEGTITSWNSAAEELYGYPAKEVVGRNLSTLYSPDITVERPDLLERIGRGNVDYLEAVHRTRDGRNIDVSLIVSPIRDAHGRLIGASTILRDITAQKKVEQELRVSEERFRMMAETAPVMIWVAGPDAFCTFLNRRWLEFTGRTLEQESGLGWFANIHPDDYPYFLDIYLIAYRARRSFVIEYRLKRSDGQYRWVEVMGVPRLMPDGDLSGYIGTCLDITERKLDEELRQKLTVRLLKMQDEERKRVAAELHDGLGQSLAIIKNRAMIGLQVRTSHENILEQLREISETATAAILEVREIAHNLRPYELDRLGLVAAIESMVQRVSESTSIGLSTHLEQIEGMLSAEAETSIYRIVQEGINNVIKHSNATSARIEIRKNGGQLTISVQDNGIGIPKQTSAIQDGKTSGLGLAGIAERVRGVGGSFEIDSHPERGTTLMIRLESESVATK